jgi:hypothetical protein
MTMPTKTKSKSITGHAVNAFNFEQVKFFCDKLGVKYDPPAGSGILIADLQTKDTAIKAGMTLFIQLGGPWIMVVNRRMDLMDPVNKLFTKVKNVVNVCDVPQSFKDDIAHYVREIHGGRKVPKIKTEPGAPEEPTDETVVQISASQVDFNSKLENIIKCFNLLKAEPKYLPNEDELKIPALQTLITALQDANTAVAESTPEVNLARLARNKEMYAPGTGGLDIAAKVKNYIKAIYGGNSSVYHEVCKFTFTKVAKYVEN